MNAEQHFYEQQDEPVRDCLLAVRAMILHCDADITASWKYGMPFFCYKKKMFCYLWVHRKLHQPYLGLVEGKHFDEQFLRQEKRSRMKIMLFNPHEDLPDVAIRKILAKAIGLYTSGIIKLKE